VATRHTARTGDRPRRRLAKWLIPCLGLVCALGSVLGAQRSVTYAPVVPAKAKPPKDWPDADTIKKQQTEAESRKLFASVTPVAITLTANFKAVQEDRNPESTKTFPATLDFTNDDGSKGSADVQIRTRGHMRRMFQTCDFAPLRIEFPKAQVKHSVFDAQHALKLGTHCRDGVKEFEQYVLREYAAYRIYNLVSPRSFRARLARVTYVNTASKKPPTTRYGMFIEDDDDVARRLSGRITEERASLSGLDRDEFTMMTLFDYMIGNLDMSIFTQHNVRLVELPSKTVYPVGYDFDYSGLVDTTYAFPPPELKVTTVRDRVFRGPCRTSPELLPFFRRFQAIKPAIAPMYDSLPDLDPGAKKRALSYLDEFYRMLDRPDQVKTALQQNCLKHGLM
jgi:hypothetical protein